MHVGVYVELILDFSILILTLILKKRFQKR